MYKFVKCAQITNYWHINLNTIKKSWEQNIDAITVLYQNNRNSNDNAPNSTTSGNQNMYFMLNKFVVTRTEQFNC